MHGIIVGLLIIFCLSVAALVAAVWIYEKSDSTAFNQILKTQKSVQDGLEEIQSISRMNNHGLNNLVKRVEELEKENEAKTEYLERLRHGQNKFDERLSRKRPVVKMPTGPIQIEIYEGKPGGVGGPGLSKNKKPLGRGVKAIMNQ